MKDVLEYLFGRLKAERPVVHAVGEQVYAVNADGTLGKPVRDLEPQWDNPTLQVGTLSGLAQLYAAGMDDLQASKVGLHVVDHRTVEAVSLVADNYGRRHVWIRAKHQEEVLFQFGKYYEPEPFLIAFRSSFLFNDAAMKVQQACSTVASGDAVMVADDGISQEITVKSGTVTKSAFALPADGIPLIPWRTFREASPVESKFLLRMKGVKDGLPQIAIFEIDAKWKLDTLQSIASWLGSNLDPAPTIIA